MPILHHYAPHLLSRPLHVSLSLLVVQYAYLCIPVMLGNTSPPPATRRQATVTHLGGLDDGIYIPHRRSPYITYSHSSLSSRVPHRLDKTLPAAGQPGDRTLYSTPYTLVHHLVDRGAMGNLMWHQWGRLLAITSAICEHTRPRWKT
jgi:hypothetical protein